MDLVVKERMGAMPAVNFWARTAPGLPVTDKYDDSTQNTGR